MARATIHVFTDKNAAEAKQLEHAGNSPLKEVKGFDVIDSRDADNPKVVWSEDDTVYIVVIW